MKIKSGYAVSPVLVICLGIAAVCAVAAYAYHAGQSSAPTSPVVATNAIATKSSATATPTPVPSSVATPAPTTVSTLTSYQLANFNYKDIDGVQRTLINGKVTFPAAGSTGSLALDQSLTATGDLNSDGVPDDIVVLSDNLGGTGNPPLIAAVLDKDGMPSLSGEHNIFTDDVDSNPTVSSVTISDGVVTVRGFIHGANQSDADAPNLAKTETYKLLNGVLTAY